MKLLIISVGKKHSPEYAAAIEMYTKRIRHFATVEWLLIPDSGTGPEGVSKEAMAINAKLLPTDIVVVLDETGTQLTSVKLSTYLESHASKNSRLVFVIGGAYGTSEQLRAKSSLLWSLGELTYPHQLVRLIIAEQLYRAFAIQSNLPYHHA